MLCDGVGCIDFMTKSSKDEHVEKCLLKFSIIVDLSLVTEFPIPSAVGSSEEVFLFSIDFTVSQNFFELVLQEVNFCLKTLALAFLSR